MKKIFNFAKKKKSSTGTPDNASLLSVGYELKDKDLSKVHKAASTGDLAKLKQLATKQKNDLNQLDKENRTALHIACAAGHVEVVQFLVESKAKLNLCDNQNRSALMKAVQGQHENCVSVLLENHAEPNLVDINGNTALHLAANIPSVSTAGLLLEHEANINAPNKEGLTPLGVAVREDHIEIAEFLLKEGADVNATDDDKRSPLMMAAGNGQIAMLRLLLRNEADITLKNDKGWSADDYAVMNGHHPCSLLIIEHGTQKSDGASSLHQDQGKKKKKLSAASKNTELGFSLGGPAIDKDAHGANQAGRDFEDNSQSESLSRVSKSGADDWPSSDNDDESPTIQKKSKRFSLNLREMIASKTGGALKQKESRDQKGKSTLSEQPCCSKATMDTRGDTSDEDEEEDEEDENEDEDEDEEEDVADDDEDDDDDDEDDEHDEEDEDEEDEENEEDESSEECEEAASSTKTIKNLFQFDQPSASNCQSKNIAHALPDKDKNASTENTTNIQSEKFGCPAEIPNSEECEHEEDLDKATKNSQTPFQIEWPKTTDLPDTQSKADIKILENIAQTSASVIQVKDESIEDTCNIQSQNVKNVKDVSNSPQPVRLDVKEDCIVSAIRVESKFSDEDDSVGVKPSLGNKTPSAAKPTSEGSDWDSVCEDEDALVIKRKSSWGSSLDSETELPNDEHPNKTEEDMSNFKRISPPFEAMAKSSKDATTPKSTTPLRVMDKPGLVTSPKKPGDSDSDWDSLSENASSKEYTMSPQAGNKPKKSQGLETFAKCIQKESDDQNEGNKEKVETSFKMVALESNEENNADDDSSWSDHEENLSEANKIHPTQDDASEDSDSHDQKLEYDFATATVKVSEEGEVHATLISYVPLERRKEDVVPSQHHGVAEKEESDEALPQTDIDDVDVDSLDESFSNACLEGKTIKKMCLKKEISTDDDSDQIEDVDDQEEGEEECDVEEEPEESEHSLEAASTIPETDTSKDKKRDFMSELGLEKEEPVQDSWDSESDLDDANLLCEKKENKMVNEEEMPTLKEEMEEIDTSNVSDDGQQNYHGESSVKETEKTKWGPLLNKCEPTGDKKTDLMEELGLGDADDLEDASDWDSASTTSKRTLPGGRRMPSPGIEEFPETPEPPNEKTISHGPVTTQQSFSSHSTPSQSAQPRPLPRARKMTPRKSDCQEDSDCDSERQSDNHMMEAVYQQALDEPESPEPKAAKTTESSESEQEEGEQPVARKLCKVNTTDSTEAEEEKRLSVSRDHSGRASENVGSEKPEKGFREDRSTQAAPKEQKPVASKQMPKEVKKNENSGEVEMAEDFDDLTQSSDTATDELDSPSAGYRHAALLVEKLDSTSLDSRNMVKLQNIFHEYERTIQKLKSRHSYLSDKVNQLEMEKVDMKNSLEEIKDVKPTLERNQLELQTEVTNLKFQLKQEQENRRNAAMMYNTTKDKLKRTEEQHQLEIQEKQKVELTLRNLELEMRTLLNNIKQLEEDHSATQRLLVQERSARALQEDLLNSHLRKQQEIEEENRLNISKSNEALSQLTEASDRERELLQQTTTLQEQINILKGDLERSQANSSFKESHLLEENETLKEQLEDTRREVKANSEALTQTVFNCNNQLTTLKSELAIMTNRFENEKQGRETLEKEVDSTRTRLAGAVHEAERCMAANADTEKALLREKEESQRLKDRLTAEGATHRETVSSLSQKLSKAESDANSLENEVHRVTLQLTEKGLLLDVLQKEKEQLAAQVKELDKTLQAQKDLVTKTGARHEATQERLAQAQSEGMLLRQQLEEANNKGEVKEKAVTDAQERFSDMLSKLRSDCEERVTLVDERNKELASKAADLREQVLKLEEEKNEREVSLRQLQQELADSLKKLSMSEASLEVNTRYRSDLEEEKTRTLKDLDRLKEKLVESEDQYVQAEKRFNSLKSSFDEKEKELAITAQRLQEALSSASSSGATIKQLEEAVQRLEIENAKLEATAKQQSNKIEALHKGAQEAAMVRGHLEELITNLQSSKMSLEDQLGREVQKQSMLSHTAQDSQALWEQEVKSRSKLGLRLSELEKEKGELTSQMEIEKKKAKKIAEQKKGVDARLEQEMNRNSELQKEMYRLRTLLKTAKKKLRDHDMGGEFISPMNSLRMDMGRLNQDPRKADDLQAQLDRETSRRSQLEKDNSDLREELSSLKCSGQNGQKHQEELLELRRQMESSQSQAEERARHDLQHKLEQVNLFLQTQAASQEALDQIKAANQASLRSQLEQRIRELESEVSRARSTQQDSLSQRDSTRTELERYRGMHSEEQRLRKSLAAKLERANTRLSDANSKLLSERSRSLIAGSFMSSSLDGAALGSSPGNLNRSLGLSLLSPVSVGQSSRVEDYLAKMQSELDRNISNELSSATAELDLASTRLSPVGSASLDPVSRATQQYLEVLKKNHRI